MGRQRRREDRRPRRLRHLLSADQRRDDARGRGAVARDDAAASGPDRGSVRLARPDRAAARVAGPVRLLADLGVPGLRCTQYPVPIRIVYTDQDLRTSYTHHFSASLQRQLATNLVVEAAYVGKLGDELVGHNYFNAAPFINSPITGQPPSLQNVEQRVPFSPGIISAQSRVLGNFFRSDYHSLQLRVDRRMAGRSRSRVLCAVEEPDEPAGEHDRPDQQHSESVRPRLAVGAVVPRSPSRRRGVLGVEPAARRSGTGSQRAAERMDAHRLPPHPVGQPAGVHDGHRRRAERHPAAERSVRAAGARDDGRRRPRDHSTTADMVARTSTRRRSCR